jgi:hypothetical protein
LTTTGASPPPLNTTVRRRLGRLAVGPLLRCAPAPSSLPGTSPVAPSRSPATPCRWLTTIEPLSHARSAHGDHVSARAASALPQATQAVFPAGLSRQAAASRLFRPAAHGRPPAEPPGRCLAAVSASRVWQAAGPSTVAAGQNSARALLNLFPFSVLVK